MTDLNMTPEEWAIADDFEKGWSAERIEHAQRSWGPARIRTVLPKELAHQIAKLANEEDVDDLTIIERALSQYQAG
ncbi:hypothetical protein J2S49_001115 [Arcanobacterium wilhelmae]|uniref:CopG family transcriptional regulator n=1 Tax=Arcanobacterium wilhelmae TaxID=1803177 RepID=A0ABT9NBD8_9ACTO|nr:hypothetical protein [Arcanobacterium wilhelmae]MDP9801039.1 hypothetical protein [Arcanobacterium wilhelmae]WFN90397.1 hypothetical protein P8A24_00610 [Arcanobacterium wilhelmae]